MNQGFSHPVPSRLLRVTALCSSILAGLLFCILPVHSDTLSPKRIQELTDLGSQIADRERAMKEAEQRLKQPGLSPEETKKLTDEIGSHRDFIDTTKASIEAQGADQKRVLDRAIEARKKERELWDARAAAAQDPSDKKLQRTVKRLETELQNDYKDIGTLPPLASATMPGSTASTGLAAVLIEECKKHVMLSSVGSVEPPRLAGTEPAQKSAFGSRHPKNPLLYLVQGSPPKPSSSGAEPTNEEIATRIADQIKNDLRQEFAGDLKEYEGLNKIKPENRTSAQETRRQEIETKVEHAVRGKLDELTGVGGFGDSDKFRQVYLKLKDFDDQLLGKGNMTLINPPSLQVGGQPSSTGQGAGTKVVTKITGSAGFFKGQVKGPGDLQLEDDKGNIHNLHVDKDLKFSGEVSTPDFKPTKFTFESDSGKWVWKEGQWQLAPAPPDPIETQAKAVVDRMSADIRNQLGNDFNEYVDLQSLGAERTPAQETRLQDIATKIRNAVQSKKDEVKGTSSFSDPKLVGAILHRLDRFKDVTLFVDIPVQKLDLGTAQTGGQAGTRIKWKLPVQGPGDLEITDGNGRIHNVHVDKDGSVDATVSTPDFKPIKATFENVDRKKTTWELQGGKWTQTGSRTGMTGQTGAMSSSTPTADPSRSPSSMGESSGQVGRERGSSLPDYDFISEIFGLKAGGMTTIDQSPRTKTYSNSFGNIPQGIVPQYVELTDESGTTYRGSVAPSGTFQVKVPETFVPLNIGLHVIGTDGKPYIQTYKLVGTPTGKDVWEPQGKFQPAPAEAKTGTSGASGQPTTGAMAPSTGGGGASTKLGAKFTASVSGSIDYQPKILSQPLDGCVSFAFAGKWEKPDKWLLNPAYEWDAFDSRSPSLEPVHQDSTYTHDVQLRWDDLRYMQDRYETIDVHGIRSASGGRSYYGTQYYVIPQFSLPLNPLLTNDRYPFPLGEVKATAQYSMLGQFKREANAWRVGRDLEEAGFPGWDSWTTWTNPSESNIYRYDLYNITDSARFDRFNLMLSPHVNYIERNEPRNVAPAPSLSPSDWPRVHATALPHWSIAIERSTR